MWDDRYEIMTTAFGIFLNNYEDLQKFCALNFTLNIWARHEDTDPTDLPGLSNEDRWLVRTLTDVGATGRTLATNLAIVYLVAIMEAYVQDAIEEITDRQIRRIDAAFASVGKLASEQVRYRLRQAPVQSGVKLLTRYFQAIVRDKETHLLHWKEIKFRRNCIVHNNGRADKKYADYVRGVQEYETIEENGLLTAEPNYVKQVLCCVHDFARDIEQSIVAIQSVANSLTESATS